MCYVWFVVGIDIVFVPVLIDCVFYVVVLFCVFLGSLLSFLAFCVLFLCANKTTPAPLPYLYLSSVY
jgi:hypothetical protein